MINKFINQETKIEHVCFRTFSFAKFQNRIFKNREQNTDNYKHFKTDDMGFLYGNFEKNSIETLSEWYVFESQRLLLATEAGSLPWHALSKNHPRVFYFNINFYAKEIGWMHKAGHCWFDSFHNLVIEIERLNISSQCQLINDTKNEFNTSNFFIATVDDLIPEIQENRYKKKKQLDQTILKRSNFLKVYSELVEELAACFWREDEFKSLLPKDMALKIRDYILELMVETETPNHFAPKNLDWYRKKIAPFTPAHLKKGGRPKKTDK